MQDSDLQMEEDSNNYDTEIFEIQREYRRQRLKEQIAGPAISTIFHIAIVAVMAVVITDKQLEQKKEITVELVEAVEEVVLEKPEEIPEEELEDTEFDSEVVDLNEIAPPVEEDQFVEEAEEAEVSTDDKMDFDEYSDVEVSPSAFLSSAFMGNRSNAGKDSSLKRFGGSKRGQKQLELALKWLKKNQNPDGSWGENHLTAMTSLSILTYLAHGDTNASKSYGKNVQKGIMWLVNQALKHRGKFVDKGRHGARFDRNVYSHGLLAYSLAEASAMHNISTIAEARDIAIAQVIKGQQANGGFHYGYKKGSTSNLSAASFNFQALKAARAAGCALPGLPEALDKAVKHLKNTATKNSFYYITGYASPRGPSMRSVGVLCLQLLGEADCIEARRVGSYIAQNDMQYLSWKGGTGNSPYAFPLYSWYYGTQVMFQRGGSDWKKWNLKFQPLLLKNQNKYGFWETPSAFEGDRFNMQGIDKKIYSTTLCALMLTVYYRYLPSSSKKKPKKASAKKEDSEELILDFF